MNKREQFGTHECVFKFSSMFDHIMRAIFNVVSYLLANGLSYSRRYVLYVPPNVMYKLNWIINCFQPFLDLNRQNRSHLCIQLQIFIVILN